MKKDKKETEGHVGLYQKILSISFKNIVIYLFFIVLFLSVVFILAYRYINKTIPPQEVTIPNPNSLPVLRPETKPLPPLLLEKEIKQNDRLDNIEKTINATQQYYHRLVAFEIMKEVLEGHVTLETFTLYLQKHPEPWTADILVRMGHIREVKTYDQLEALLVPPPSSITRSSFLWRQIKKIIKSFVQIRKLESVDKNIDMIQIALRAHNIKQAVEIFHHFMPPEQYTHHAIWWDEAQNRLTLEDLQQHMLLSIAEN